MRLCSPIFYWQSEQATKRNEWVILNGQERAKPDIERHWLQDSLHVTGCCFALPSQEDTPLQHNRSPGSTGSLLRGLLAVTTVGLSPTSGSFVTNIAIYCA